LPPSGAYVAKKLLLDAAVETEQWWWELVMQAGGFFTASYVLVVLAYALWPADGLVKLRAPVPRLQEAAALALALCSLLLGLAAIGPVRLDDLSFASKELWAALWPMLAGGVLVFALTRWGRSRLPRIPQGDIAVAIDAAVRAAPGWGKSLERVDGRLRQWPVAGLSLLVLVIMFAAALLAVGGSP
jgi:multicomponent Na+:H+ antiporter subunit D